MGSERVETEELRNIPARKRFATAAEIKARSQRRNKVRTLLKYLNHFVANLIIQYKKI